MIDAVLLDAGGVLVLPEHEALLAVLSGTGEPPADLDAGHYLGMQALDAFDSHNEEAWTSYLAAFARHLCETADVSVQLRTTFRSVRWARVIEESLEALRRLSASGVGLAVVSNSNGMAEANLRASRVCQVGPGEGVEVSIVIDSHVVGVEKPDPAIFAMALDALGVGPEAAVHVGDSLRTDVAGAQNAGIRPLHFDPYRLCRDGNHEHVVSLLDVVALVER